MIIATAETNHNKGLCLTIAALAEGADASL